MRSTGHAGKTASSAELEAAADKALRILKAGDSRAEIFLLPGRRMRDLKRKTTGKNPRYDPDVLSFENPAIFPHPEDKRKALGEIYINSGIARTDPDRAVFLVIHGLLHLLGYSHSRKNDILKMEKAEKTLMNKLRA